MMLVTTLRPWALALALVVGIVQGAAGADPPPSSSVDAIDDADRIAALDRTLLTATGNAGPGAVLLVARGDQPIYRRAHGQANIELGVPLAPEQMFKIASITKMFTAAMVVKLAEAGRLSLDDPLSLYLADAGAAGDATLRQLLSHTAGISDRETTPDPGFGRTEMDTATRIVPIARRPLLAAPGSLWAYANSGYILLGAVIEKVTGQPWHAAIQSSLLSPLGLHRTGYDRVAAIQPGRAAGYTTAAPQGLRNAVAVNMSVPAAAGAFISTVDDLLIWMQALSHGRVVSPDGFRAMCEPTLTSDGQSHDYGFGLYRWTVRGELAVGHTGQIAGFAAVLLYLPRQDVTIIAIGNDDAFDARLLGRRVAAIMLDQPYPDLNPTPVPVGLAKALTGDYRFVDNGVLTLFAQDGTLMFRRGARQALPLGIDADGRLRFIPDDLTYFVPRGDPTGRIIGLDYIRDGDAPAIHLPRIPALP